MWIRTGWIAPMQAYTDSGHFFTVRMILLYKKNLENQFWNSKKKVIIFYSIQKQNRQGFLYFHRLKPLILQAFLQCPARKRFPQKVYS
jgi:hypothetical protein